MNVLLSVKMNAMCLCGMDQVIWSIRSVCHLLHSPSFCKQSGHCSEMPPNKYGGAQGFYLAVCSCALSFFCKCTSACIAGTHVTAVWHGCNSNQMATLQCPCCDVSALQCLGWCHALSMGLETKANQLSGGIGRWKKRGNRCMADCS